jgi:predicted nucleic acid-binding protein
MIPPAVYAEVVEKGKKRVSVKEFEEASWLSVKEVMNKTALRLITGHLDLGEAEAVVLTEEVNADLLLVDDLKARRFATLAGLRIGGTIMVLIVGMRQNLLSEPPEIVLQKLRRAGMYLSDEVAKQLLKAKM